ncbi:MAG: integration host factor, actinobacterial type [Actinomycetota bacterium]|nr:integration host factor, actinobacterial type [Actinomycetota bacterium]
MPFNNLSKETRQKGLIKAREIRKKRAELKQNLKSEKTSLKAVFENQEFFQQVISNMKALELISSLPGIGRIRAENILTSELKINTSKKIGGLGNNQKKRFCEYFKIGDKW